MTDEELIARLRHYAQIAHAAAAWGFAGEGEVMNRAADRIEQLAATNEALVKERDARPTWQERKDILYAGYRQKVRVKQLEAVLRKIADDDGAGTWQSNHARAALKGESNE